MPGLRLTLALAVAALGATAAATQLHLHARLPDAARVGEPALPELAGRADDVTRLTVTTAGDRFTFARDDRGWSWVERADYPVPADRVESVLAGLAALRLAAPLTIRPDRYDRLGLSGIVTPDSRSIRLDAEAGDGTPLGRILLGDRRRGGLEGLYVRQAFAARSWLADGDIEVPADPIAWLDRRLVDIEPGRVGTIAVEDAGGAAVRLVRPAPDAPFAVAATGGRVIPDDVADSLAGLLAMLDLTDIGVVDDDGTGEPRLSFAVTTFDGVTVEARFLPADAETLPWVRLSAAAADGAAADGGQAAVLARRFGRWVYRLSPERLDRFARALTDLQAAVTPSP
ncbi:MAG: DUF4340 domain-containing protein [Rhodospirillaceae bacterium]|nr:DUF4340 domain-containing protein [Rhodospirillaceae bacterium]